MRAGHDSARAGASRRRHVALGETQALGERPGRATGPAGSALGALNLFLALFESVFFRSLIFGHCS